MKSVVRYCKIRGSEDPNLSENCPHRASWRQKWVQQTSFLLSCAQLRSKVAPRATETAKIGTLRRILGQHKKVLDVQGAMVLKGESRTTAAFVVAS